jgi:hypothetical protein
MVMLKQYPDVDLANVSVEVLIYSEKAADTMEDYVHGILQPSQLDGKTELEPVVDRDLDRFAEFYQRELGNDKLSGFERSVIKTYLHWKTHPQKK